MIIAKKQWDIWLNKILNAKELVQQNQSQEKFKCLYANNDQKYFKGVLIVNDMALVFVQDIEEFYDQMFFTYFVIEIKQLEMQLLQSNFKIEIVMKDNRWVRLILEQSLQSKIVEVLQKNTKEPFVLEQMALKYNNLFQEKQDKNILKKETIHSHFHSIYQDKNRVLNYQEFGLKVFNNENFEYCSSYNNFFIVPEQISQQLLEQVFKFRVKSRIPILSYVYKTGSYLFRSSQIQSGLLSKWCEADEFYINILGQLNKSNKQKQLQNLLVCDARSKVAAFGNKIMGKGSENTEYYKNIWLSYHNLPNLDEIQSSYKQILSIFKLKNNKRKSFYYQLGNSRWYEYIQLQLEFAVFIIHQLEQGSFNVLIHCSDGWDRTSQICALVKILTDKQFRTINGILNIIYQEFSVNGFQFSTRGDLYNEQRLEANEKQSSNGYYYKRSQNKKQSPIFIQFLDAIRQIVIQFPQEFQFNIQLINDLDFYAWLGVFKELLFDCQRARQNYQNEFSMFDFFNYYHLDYYNQQFSDKEIKDLYKQIKTHDIYLQFWKEHFLQNFPYDNKTLFI